ncbi:uncharacterized protein LOC144746142 isoform X2 [Ciona intestinalis]
MLDLLVKYGVVNEDDITDSAEKIVSATLLSQLVEILEGKLKMFSKTQTDEMSEVQKYVERVRILSDERDKLTTQFDLENERLRSQLKDIIAKSEMEKHEMEDMCSQEGLVELVGSSFSEQMAYLLVVRATLLDNVDALHDQLDNSNKQHDQLKQQIEALTSEDSELRGRMNNAMSEMGGMASKLTDALRERDRLKDEVVELTQALDGIKSLPSVAVAKAEAATHMRELESQREFYQVENEKLRDELLKGERNLVAVKDELNTEVAELLEMNKNLKEVNKQLNNQLNNGVGDVIMDRQTQRQKQSKKIIEEMQNALEEGEARTNEEISKLKQHVESLKMEVGRLEGGDGFEVKGQLAELRKQHDDQRVELEMAEGKISRLEREVSVCKLSEDKMMKQRDVHVGIERELEARNIGLEGELSKVLAELESALNQLDETKRQMLKLNEMSVGDEKVRGLQDKIDELESRLFNETSGTNKVVVGSFVQPRLENDIATLQRRALNAEAQLLLLKGEESQQLTETLVADLNRDQLEDAVDLMRRRLELSTQQTRSYVDKYKNIKLKHKSKMRRIRELFLLERSSMVDEVERLERRLELATSALDQELSWKDEVVEGVRVAEVERREAINRVDQVTRVVEERWVWGVICSWCLY